MFHKRLLLTLIALVTLASIQIKADETDPTLFTELGGSPNIERFTEDLLTIVLHDERMRALFKDTNIKRLKKLLYEQFCALSGGPCQYSGDDMKTVHQGMHLNNAQFNALVEDLQMALTQNQVPYAIQNKLLAKLAPMQKEIVSK